MLLLGALVGYSAYGGFGNNAITNWYRDKGYGMGAKVGFIPALIGGKTIHVSSPGNVPKPTLENSPNSRAGGSCSTSTSGASSWSAPCWACSSRVLYVTVLPRGETLPAGASPSPRPAASSRSGASAGSSLFFGFWILFSTAISNVDLVVRQATDMLWFCLGTGPEVGQGRHPQHLLWSAGVLVDLGLLYVNITVPLIILAISANVANFTMALSAILTIIVNRKFLPKEYRGASGGRC